MLLVYPHWLPLGRVMGEFTIVSVSGHLAYGVTLGVLVQRLPVHVNRPSTPARGFGATGALGTDCRIRIGPCLPPLRNRSSPMDAPPQAFPSALPAAV